MFFCFVWGRAGAGGAWQRYAKRASTAESAAENLGDGVAAAACAFAAGACCVCDSALTRCPTHRRPAAWDERSAAIGGGLDDVRYA